MTSKRKDIFAFFGLLGLLFVFYPELCFVSSAPLTGDHLNQHYPWAFLLAESIKTFHFPLWTNSSHCGFPIAAEGQIGIFYLPNLILLFLLPFKMAYSYMNLFHWLLAGWGTYIYAKQMKLNALSAFVAAVIFVFGAAYGGAFYNITSLKTVAWFPLGLWLFEKYFTHSRWTFLLGLALIVSQSLVAGYLQVAILTWLIFSVYVVSRVLFFADAPLSWSKRGGIFFVLVLTALGALIFSAPQIYLTFQLAMQSNRVGLAEGYAYVGSMSPLVLGTFINPYISLDLRGNNLYAGALSLFFILLLFCSPDIRRNQFFRLWCVMIGIALLLALGRWSPLYILIIKVTRFYSFRIPAKFLIFICFGVAILTGMGFQQVWNGNAAQAALKKAGKIYFWVVGMFLGIMIVFGSFLTAGRHVLIGIGEYYIRHFVYGQPGHPRSLESYLAAVNVYPDSLRRYFTWQNPQNLWLLFVLAIGAIFVFLFRKRSPSKLLLIFGFIFILVDLYALSYIDIRLDFDAYKSILKPSPAFKALDTENQSGRLERIFGLRSLGEQLPLVPSQNILFSIEDIGAYSPFVFSRYFQTIGLLGNVNDSNFQASPSVEYFLERLPLLSFLNVSHVLSSKLISTPSLKLIEREKQYGSYLYQNLEKHQPAYFLGKLELYGSWDDLRAKLMAPHFDPRQSLLLEREELQKFEYAGNVSSDSTSAVITLIKQSDDLEEWEVESNQAGFFVLPQTYFTGWQAQIDGRHAPILKAYGLFRALWLSDSGRHRIKFFYRPFELQKS